MYLGCNENQALVGVRRSGTKPRSVIFNSQVEDKSVEAGEIARQPGRKP